MRFYGFHVDEIISESEGFLDPQLDPKLNWAINNLDYFPVEVTTASYEQLLRIPGIGVRGAQKIIQARKTSPLGEMQLKKLGIAMTRARYFITCNGKWFGKGMAMEPQALRAQLAKPINGGSKGRRSTQAIPGQMSFEELDSSFNIRPESSQRLKAGKIEVQKACFPQDILKEFQQIQADKQELGCTTLCIGPKTIGTMSSNEQEKMKAVNKPADAARLQGFQAPAETKSIWRAS